MNYFWFEDSLKEAVSNPRLHSQLFPNMVLAEPNFPKKYIKSLKRYGHKHITNDTTLFIGKYFVHKYFVLPVKAPSNFPVYHQQLRSQGLSSSLPSLALGGRKRRDPGNEIVPSFRVRKGYDNISSQVLL